jgi:hypothetical protein
MNEVTVRHLDDMHAGEHAGPGKFLDVSEDLGLTGVDLKVMKMPANWSEFPEGAGEGMEQVYVVLEGAAALLTPDGSTELYPGVVVRVSPGVARKIIPGDVGATILAIGTSRH